MNVSEAVTVAYSTHVLPTAPTPSGQRGEDWKNQLKEDKQISQDQPKENSQSLLHKISDKWIFVCQRDKRARARFFFPTSLCEQATV